MPNPPRPDLVRNAICDGILGNIEWKQSALLLARANPDLHGVPAEGIRQRLREFVRNGGEIEVRPETRREYLWEDPDNPYWYRVRLPAPEISQTGEIFVEIVLWEIDEEQPWIRIVSVHP